MSKRAVMGFLVLAIILAVAAAFLLRPKPSAPRGGPILSFRPSQVTEIRITREGPDGASESLVRSGEGWAHRQSWEPEHAAWPVAPSSVEGALRILAALSGASIDAAEAPAPGSRAGVIEIDAAGRTWRMLASPDVLGGRRAVTVTTPDRDMIFARVDGEILDALLDTGPGVWREMFALPGVSLDTSRIAIRSHGGLITLVRSQGRWLMADPVAVAGHQPAVTDLLQRLAGIRLDRFIDEPEADTAYGLSEPEAQIRLEREIRRTTESGDVERTIETRELTVGDPADLAGELRFARVSRTLRRAAAGAVPDINERIVVVRHASLESIMAQPAVYIDPRTLQRPPEDIGGVEVTRSAESAARAEVLTSLTRTLDGWRRTVPEAPIILGEEQRLVAFIREMSAAGADSVVLDPPPGSLLNPVSVVFKTLGGGLIAEVTIGALIEGQGGSAVAHIGVRSGQVVRVYKREIPWIEQFIADP